MRYSVRPAFASWLGWLTGPDQPAAFVLEAGQDRADLVRQARGIGYEQLAGELAGGMPAWETAALPVRRIRLTPAAEVIGSVLDVRQAAEYHAGHLPGASHIELGSLTERAAQLDGEPLTLMCGHGERAMTAASLLARHGHQSLAVAIGGPPDWAAAHGRSLETGG